MTGPDGQPRSASASFADLLDAARYGESWGFEGIYQRLHRRVYSFARVRGCSDPEGLVNDVFAAAFGALTSFSGGEEQFKALVFRIARNRIIDDYRHRARRPDEVALDDDAAESHAGAESAENEALSRIGADELVSLLDVLTTEQREVILLRTVGDLTVEAVAKVVGKQPGAVKALQRRAIRALIRELSADGRTPGQPFHVAESRDAQDVPL